MAKIGKDYLGERPKLTPDLLEGNAAVLTIASVETFNFDNRDNLVLKFEETGDAALFVNRTMLDALIDGLGDETDEWVGSQVPVEVKTVKNPQNGEDVEKVYVMDFAEWDEAFTAAGVKAKRAKAVKSAKGKR